MSEDDKKNEVLGFAMLMRALANGASAFEYLSERDPGFLEWSFASCAVVFAMWPDDAAESGVGLLPIKRTARVGIEQKSEVIPCASREAAGRLLKRFGNDALQAEFADYLRPLN